MSASARLPFLRTTRRLLVQVALLALAFLLGVAVLPGGTASAAAAPVAQCNSVLNQGGQGVECSVTVVNTLDVATGVGSAVVTVQQCTGAIGATTCSAPVTSTFTDVVTSVSQCNDAASGGGGAVTCTVRVTNDVTGGAAPVAASVNQCIGSGDGSGTVICSPVGATVGAAVTQCNGSGNGGGSTVRCTVADGSTQSPSLPVRVEQCNGSANGGGSLVTCRTSITNNVIAAVAPPTPASSPASSPAAVPAEPSPASPAEPSPAAPTSPAATGGETAAPPAAAAPVAVSPTTSESPAPLPPVAAPEPAAPVQPAQPAEDPEPEGAELQDVTSENVQPDTGVLPDALAASTGGAVVQASGRTAPVAPALPTTGADAALLALLGALTTAAGAVLLLATRRPRGRHVLRSRHSC